MEVNIFIGDLVILLNKVLRLRKNIYSTTRYLLYIQNIQKCKFYAYLKHMYKYMYSLYKKRNNKYKMKKEKEE